MCSSPAFSEMPLPSVGLVSMIPYALPSPTANDRAGSSGWTAAVRPLAVSQPAASAFQPWAMMMGLGNTFTLTKPPPSGVISSIWRSVCGANFS